MAVKRLKDLDIKGKRVLIREDLNVPVANGKVTSDKRVLAALPTIEYALKAGASVLVMSHLGRPTEGVYADEFSLQAVADHLSGLLGKPVPLVSDYLEKAPAVEPGSIALLENVRFNKGEKKNEAALCEKYAALCDVYVMDAFGTSHRAQASTHGVGMKAPIACAGPLLVAELDALEKALANPKRPLVAIVGGSKVSTKLTVLDSLVGEVDQLIVGGGIANTFIAANGGTVGKSLYEEDLVEEAGRLMKAAASGGGAIPVPGDVVCGKEFAADAQAVTKRVGDVDDSDMIFDIGPETAEHYASLLKSAGTILWNGPVGVFEFDQFGQGTEILAHAIAESDAFSIAGGGDTLAAVDKYGVSAKISYISTGGGAFLEFLEGKKLPAVEMLEQRAS